MLTDKESFKNRILEAQNGNPETEKELLEDNLPLVAAISKRFISSGLDFEDLKQIGSIGLLKAIRRFDTSYDVCFSTYAVPLIAGEIRRFLRDDGIIKFSRSTKSLAAKIRQAVSEEPNLTIDMLAARFKVSKEELAAAYAADSPISSLEETYSDGEENLYDRIGVESSEEKSVRNMTLESALSSLSDKERLIVRLRYKEDKTQADVGKLLGVSQVQVSRMEKKILSVLRNRMKD